MKRSNVILLVAFFWTGIFFSPVVVAERSDSIGTSDRLLLFVDDHDVLYRPWTRRELQSVNRSPLNPMIVDTQPWEGTIAYCSVHRDASYSLVTDRHHGKHLTRFYK